MAFRTPVAQRLVGEPGKYDQINFVAKSGVSQAELAKRLSAVIPAPTEAVTGKAITAETQSALRKSLSFFYTFLLIFAVVAVLVGAFMMFNTFSITVAQRTRENGLLRALGASRPRSWPRCSLRPWLSAYSHQFSVSSPDWRSRSG